MAPLGTILLVDGSSPAAEETAGRLRQDGYECDVAGEISAAFRLVASRGYDLLIAMLPPHSGRLVELVQRAEEQSPGLPAIIVTDSPCMETAVRVVGSPVLAYLPTRVEYGELRLVVQSALARTAWFRGLRMIRDRLRQCAGELDDLLTVRNASTLPPEQPSVRVPLTTMQGVASCLSELVGMVSRRHPENQLAQLCELLQCPIWKVQQNVIYKAILLLNETKRRFKSKELAEVRNMLESLLQALG